MATVEHNEEEAETAIFSGLVDLWTDWEDPSLSSDTENEHSPSESTLSENPASYRVIKELQNKLDEKEEMVSQKTEPARNFVRGGDEGLAYKRLLALLFGNVV